jgi:hypothetical protein
MLRTSARFAAALLFTAVLSAVASAGPYFGPFFGDWCPPHDCPQGEYCPLHFVVPGYYRLRACVHPSNVDQYPDGVPIMGTAELAKQRCRTSPPMPSSPYADPAGYYGRSMTPYVGFGTVSGDAK